MAVPPITCEKIYAIPIANVGAPPVRDKIVCSPTFTARSFSSFGVIANPHEEIT